MSGATETAKLANPVETRSERTLIEMPNRTHRMNGAYCDSIKQGMCCFKLQPSCGMSGKEKPGKRPNNKRPKFTMYEPNQSGSSTSPGKRRRISGKESPEASLESPRTHSSSDSDMDGKNSPFSESAPVYGVSQPQPESKSTYGSGGMIQTIVTVEDTQDSSIARSSPMTPLTPMPQQLLSPQPGLLAFPHAPQFTFSPTVAGMPMYPGTVMFVSPAPLTPTCTQQAVLTASGARSPSISAGSPSRSPKLTTTSGGEKTFKYQEFTASAKSGGPNGKPVNGSANGPLKFIDYTPRFPAQQAPQNAKSATPQQQQQQQPQQQQQQSQQQQSQQQQSQQQQQQQVQTICYDQTLIKSPLRHVLKELFLKHSHIQCLPIDKNCVVILCIRRTSTVNGMPSFNPRLILQSHSDGNVDFVFEVNSVVAKSGKYPEDIALLHELIVSLDPSSCYCICSGLSEKVQNRIKDVNLQMKGVRNWGFPFQRIDHQDCDLWVKSSETMSICSKCLVLEEGLAKFLR